MPLRSSPTAWWNAPGVVAAWQPIAAPNPYLARCNMAHGEDNRYLATPGTAPTWKATTGWTFNGSSQYLWSGITPETNQNWSMLIRIANARTTQDQVVLGCRGLAPGQFYFCLWTRDGSGRTYGNGGILQPSGNLSGGVAGFGGTIAYLNGLQESGTIGAPAGTNIAQITIGCYNANGSLGYYYQGDILAILLCATPLPPATALHVSRQLAYCDVNLDWSAWARRRRYYYGPEVAAAAQVAAFDRYYRNRRI